MSEKKKDNKNKVLISVLIISVIVFIVEIVILVKFSGKAQGTWYYEDTISVKDGVMELDKHSVEIDIDDDYSCEAYVKWGDENYTPGALPLLVIRDEKGNEVAWVSGDRVDSKLEFDVTSGKYYVETEYYLTAEEFVNAANSMIHDKEVWIEDDGSVLGFDTFGKDCSFTNWYEIELHMNKGNKDLVMIAYIVLMGLLIIIIGVTFIFTLDKKNTAKYDEREILVQGQSYKYGFYTLLIYFGIAGFLIVADLIPFLSVSIVCVTGIMTGLLVYAGHALWNDAYFPLNQRRSTVFWGLGIIGLSNLMIGVPNCLKHGFITDGKLNIFCVNFVCVAAIIILIAEIIVKMIVEKNEDKE